jgi:hypothetical protein
MKFNSIYTISTETLDKTELELYEFGKLPNGWDYGQGVPADHKVILLTVNIYKFIRWRFGETYGFSSTPLIDGGIQLTLDKDDDFVDIIVNTNLSLDFKQEKGFGSNFSIITSQKKAQLSDILNILWLLSGSYTSKNTVSPKSDSTPFSGPTTVVYQSSTSRVPSKKAILFATT